MSMEYIRKHYGVPAKRGGKVRFAPYGNQYLACEGGNCWLQRCIPKNSDGRPKTRRDLPSDARPRIPVSHITTKLTGEEPRSEGKKMQRELRYTEKEPADHDCLLQRDRPIRSAVAAQFN